MGILQDGLSFEVVAFVQTGLLAFNPVSGYLNLGVPFVGVADEETFMRLQDR